MKKPTSRQHSRGPSARGQRRIAVTAAIAAALIAAAGMFGYGTLKEYIAPGGGGVPSANVLGSEYFNQAKVQIFQEERELGTMSVSEERVAEFFLRNIGGKPLEITQVRTSCMCTFAQVSIEGEKASPLFNMEMHNPPDVQRWRGIVEPSTMATIQVLYRPSLMPVQGSVARNVKFNTNDPSRPVVELGIHATVQ